MQFNTEQNLNVSVMPKHSISIIICTVNRSDFLNYVLTTVSLWSSSCQELIVVVGPCQDNTELILLDYKNIIDKIIHTEFKNVSTARNLGLIAASGEVVLYLDDDVIPSEKWLKHHLQAHQQGGKQCGCVAGVVADCTQADTPIQFARGVSSRLSESRPVLSKAAQQHYLINSYWFPAVMGANASYKREALLKVGGFDEFFEYFLEETDICLRLLEVGYQVHHLDVAVEHYVQPSHNRHDRIHLTCWYSLAKNTVYFALKHRKASIYAPLFWLRLGRLLIYRCWLRILRLKWTHGLSNQLLLQYLKESVVGIKDGVWAGLQSKAPHCEGSGEQRAEKNDDVVAARAIWVK